MHLDPHSPEAAIFVADYLADGATLEDALHDHAFRCGDCGELFSTADDVGYGEGRAQTCRDCCVEENQTRIYGRRYGWGA